MNLPSPDPPRTSPQFSLGTITITRLIYVPRTNDDRSPSTSLVPFTAVSLSMKLPRLLVLFCLRPNRPRPELFPPLELDVAPPTQRKTIARKRHATAAHMKPKLYFPSVAVVPADLNALRPCTNAALCNVSILNYDKEDIVVKIAHVIKAAAIVWKKRPTEQRALVRKLPTRLHKARRPRTRAQAEKKSAMNSKANMKRVSR